VIYCTFDDFRDNNFHLCLWLFIVSLKYTCNYCVDGSICYFKFPKVVLARISDEVTEVSTLCTVLLIVYSEFACHFLLKLIHILQTQTKRKVGMFLADHCNSTFGYCHSMSSVVCHLSVVICLSVTRVYCDNTAEARIMQFSVKCSPMP